MIKNKFIVGMVGLTAGIGMMAQAQEEKPVPAPVWKSNPKMTRYLARPERILAYTVQPPSGQTAHQTKQPRLIAYTWLGQTTKTGVTPNLTLALMPTFPVNNKPVTPEQLLAGSLNTLKRGHTDWTQTPVERGQINGVTFARAYWTGTERQRSRKLRGVSYMAVDGKISIAMQSQDLAPDSKPGTAPDATQTPAAPQPGANAQESGSGEMSSENLDRLKLAEAAMQTFRRYVAPKPTAPTP